MNVIDTLRAKGLHVEYKSAPWWRFWDRRYFIRVEDKINRRAFAFRMDELILFSVLAKVSSLPPNQMFEVIKGLAMSLQAQQDSKG